MNDNNSPESITQSEKASSNNQSHSGDGDNVAGNKIIINQASINPETKPSLNKLSNLNRSGVVNFVGREKQLEELHQLLQENEQVSISAIAGMGGIGKTELALQYAQTYQDEYPGSLCWFSVRGENLVTQIIEFAATYLNIIPPKERESDLDKVKYCWQNWQREPSLIILDDVPNFGQFYQEQITPCLPPVTSKIKVLMTSRERPGKNIPSIDLDVLTEAKALELLQFFIGKSRIEAEPELAKDLCRWLGYLPLGLELVGRYIEIDPSLTLESTLENLKSQQLKAEELLEPEQKDMTAQLGIAAAFELSWQELNSEVQRLESPVQACSTHVHSKGSEANKLK
ncbi:MAG: NB-ARC domain-containing protein [Cyanobacteria bacterium J06558_2]